MTADRGSQALIRGVNSLYQAGQTDYSFEPIILEDRAGKPLGRIQDRDAVIFCCRRGEREIQLTEAFTDPELDKFPREKFSDLPFVIFTLYHEKFKDLPVAFAPSKVNHSLGEMVSRAGLSQLRCSESEKFAHITFFLNGGTGQPFKGETDIRIPSPKGIPFEQKPELSLPEVTAEVTKGITRGYDLIVTNFANGDVIGHTANLEAKINCAEIVDGYLGDVIRAAEQAGYVILVTADHGNLEETVSEEGGPHVSHTSNPVRFFLIDPHTTQCPALLDGKLADIAPTLLNILSVPIPAEMTGIDLSNGHVFGSGRKAILIILDGWGVSAHDETDPIAIAPTPFWDEMLGRFSHSLLDASGAAVGLKPGKAGNSEAGHMNIGTGRVVLQDDVRLEKAMKDGSFYKNEVLLDTIEHVRRNGSSLHLIGLLTEKSSHGAMDYPLAVLKMAQEAGLQQVFLHMIFDGRSTEPGSAPQLLEKLGVEMEQIGLGTVVTGVGRGIALDRDGNYQKTQKAYDALVYGTGNRVGL